MAQTQRAISGRAGISQSVLSRAERGEIADLKIGTLDRIAASLGATLVIDLRYQGGLADRLVDRTHAALVDLIVGVLRHAGWVVEVEFSFNVFGDRGSVDVLGWHAASRTLLIVEVKSAFTDLQAMLLSLGRKLRVVPDLVRRQNGWDPIAVSRIVIASGTAANRAVVDRHPSIFAVSLPATAREIRNWIRAPVGPIAGVWLVSDDLVPFRSAPTKGSRRS